MSNRAEDSPLSVKERDELIDSMARRVVSKRLEMPVIFTIEAHKPFSFMTSQALLLGAPMLGAIWGYKRMTQWSKLLEVRENVDRLVARIEELAELRDSEKQHGDHKK